MKKRASIFQEERKTTTSRRDMSADDVQYRSKLMKEKSSYDTMAYGSKKKYEENEEQDSLINKCMLSWPNKFSLEQIKKH